MDFKEKFEKYEPKKRLGQNFLTDENIARKIVAAIGAEDSNVLEIGPGHSALTKYLTKLTPYFLAVDIDENIVENLKAQGVNVILKDFLKFDFKEDTRNIFKENSPVKIIGNIPYNITSPILFKIFDAKDGGENIERVVMMVQKEVADRFAAKPNTKDYGILAVQVQARAYVKTLFNVPRTVFFPKPNVDSAVTEIVFKENVFENSDRDIFVRLVRDSFSQRRKVMRNPLKNFFNDIGIGFDELDFDFSRRAEDVTPEEYIKLAGHIKSRAK